MNKTITFFVLLCAAILPMQAQQYATGSDNVYSLFVNAAEQYTNYCVQDNTAQDATFRYLITPYEKDSKLQQFKIIAYAKDTTQYYVQNPSTRKLWSTASKASDAFNALCSVASKTATQPFTFTPIADNQVLISYNENGEIKYLNAADEESVYSKVYLEQAKDSRYAWYIIKADQQLTDIDDVTEDTKIQVNALDGHIIVAGTTDYQIYDITGREMPKIGKHASGLYIVHANGQSFKVLVK